MKHYLFEAAWYSPHSYEVYHYAVVDVDAVNFHDAQAKAVEVLRKHGKRLRMGTEPITLKLVGPTHHWGNGYRPGVEPILRENPLSLQNKELIIGGVVVAAIAGLILYFSSTAKAATAGLPPLPPNVPTGPSGTATNSSGVTVNLPSTPTGGGAPLPPSAGGPAQTSTPVNYQVTEANNNSTINMHVGDSITVLLDLTAPITDYNFSLVGTTLSSNSPTDLTDQMFQTWNATAVGTAAIVYTPVPSGTLITFNVVIT